MAKKYASSIFAILAIAAISFSCSKDREASRPVYLDIPELKLDTDYLTEGTSSSKLTTGWVQVNGDLVGAFEIPFTVPVILNQGKNDIKIYPGINLNGISSTRAIYVGFEDYSYSVDYTPSTGDADTISFDSIQRITSYNSFVTIDPVEYFDSPGINLEKSVRSDTNAQKVSDTSKVFINHQKPSEENGNAGALYTTNSKDVAELITIKSYQLPIGGANVYLEMNYKSNMPFTVGVVSLMQNGQHKQEPTVVINPKEDWNKIYINLVTEVSGNSNATGYKIFFYARHTTGSEVGAVYLDNLKLVY